MNASSSKTLVIGLGGLGLLFVVAAANKAKAAQAAADEDPDVTPPGPPTPIGPLPSSLPADATPQVPLQPPALNTPSLDPNTYPPGPPIPLDMAPVPQPLDPMIEPPGPPMPMQPVTTAPLPAAPPAAPAPSMPTFPVTTLPAASATPSKLPANRPFGDQPLDVQATQSNVKPPTASSNVKTAAPVPAAKRSAAQAALDLLGYVTPILKAKRGSELGLKNQPNALVKAAQIDMGDVPADGIYGPRTRAKGTALIGKPFPARV